MSLMTLDRALNVAREIDPGMHTQVLQGFLYIAGNPGCRIVEMQAHLETSSASATRITKRLSRSVPPGQKGYGLVEVGVSDEDSRERELWLTPKGQRFAKRLEEALK